MKLIIDIDDKVYDELLTKELDGMLTCKQVECMNVAIYDGIPLDKLEKVLWENADYNANIGKEYVWYWKIKEIFQKMGDYINKGE